MINCQKNIQSNQYYFTNFSLVLLMNNGLNYNVYYMYINT